jgi:tRNA(fMet)-specific endonuclease VapC
MNGIKYFLDTNAIINLLNGNSYLKKRLNNADWIGISVISQLEFLSYSKISELDKQLFSTFLQRVEVVNLVNSHIQLASEIISIRKHNNLKLPDAIIAASAVINNCILVTNDKAFDKVTTLQALTY